MPVVVQTCTHGGGTCCLGEGRSGQLAGVEVYHAECVEFQHDVISSTTGSLVAMGSTSAVVR